MTHSRAYIFDLDGTLVDSLADIAGALNAGLAILGERSVSAARIQSWVGDGLPTLCRRAMPKAPEDVIDTLIRHVKTHYQKHCADYTKPYPNVLQMLNLLKDRDDPMAVLSNKPHELTVQLVQQLGLREYFACVRGYHNEAEKKPAPTVSIELAKQLGARPDSTRFVGDSAVDIETARNAGMIAVSVTWGFQPRDALEAARPDFLVSDPMEIPRIQA